VKGKRRASGNSYRHGFSRSAQGFDLGAIERLARKIAGPKADSVQLDWARSAAEAELTLRQIEETKSSLINRVLTFGEFQAGEPAVPNMPTRQLWNYLQLCLSTQTFPRPSDATKTMPPHSSDRAAESIRRALPALVKLENYARLAAGRRDAAIRRLLAEDMCD